MLVKTNNTVDICSFDGKPCKFARKCVLRILEVCASCDEDFAAVNYAKITSCAECNARREFLNKYRKRKQYKPCEKTFRCLLRDGDEMAEPVSPPAPQPQPIRALDGSAGRQR